MADYDPFYEASFEVNCSVHGRSRSLSGDCAQCIHEADVDSMANEGAHRLCGGCAHADDEHSNARYTWCTAWKPAGFPCRPRVKRCARYKPRQWGGYW